MVFFQFLKFFHYTGSSIFSGSLLIISIICTSKLFFYINIHVVCFVRRKYKHWTYFVLWPDYFLRPLSNVDFYFHFIFPYTLQGRGHVFTYLITVLFNLVWFCQIFYLPYETTKLAYFLGDSICIRVLIISLIDVEYRKQMIMYLGILFVILHQQYIISQIKCLHLFSVKRLDQRIILMKESYTIGRIF